MCIYVLIVLPFGKQIMYKFHFKKGNKKYYTLKKWSKILHFKKVEQKILNLLIFFIYFLYTYQGIVFLFSRTKFGSTFKKMDFIKG